MKRNKNGFTLIELLIVVVIFGIVGSILASFMFSRVNFADRMRANKEASDALQNALTALTTTAYDNLPPGGSFNKIDEGTIEPTGCTPTTCDFVLETPGAMVVRESPAGGVKWKSGYVPPEGAQIAFVRRWKIEEMDNVLRLRRVTVAVLADEQSANPLAMIDTIVGDR